jgi:hypothetical protein
MNDLEKAQYALIKWRQYDKLYLPIINKRFLKSGLAVHKSFNIKGRIFHKILKSPFCFRILNKFSLLQYEEPERFDGFRWNEWKNYALKAIGIESGWAAFSFPQNKDKRFIALLIDNEGQISGFAKVALDEKTTILFKNEANALKYFLINKPREFLIPKMLYEAEFDEGYYFIQTIIPFQTQYFSNIKDMRWLKIINEIANINKVQKPLSHFSWWKELKTTQKPIRTLLRYLETKCREKIDVCNVHGDFGPGNILYDKDTFWVYDWEEFNQVAPIMTDYLAYVIECFLKLRFTTNRGIANKIINYLRRNVESADNYNLAIALAYMSTKRSWTIDDRLCNALCEELLRCKN